MMNERKELLRKIAMVDFAVTELHMFLDTHRFDFDSPI